MPLPCPDPDVLATTLSLLEWGERAVTWKDRNGKTSLMALIQHSGFSGWPPDADLKAMARALVDAGANLHAQDSSQDTVLLYTENLPRWMGILTPLGLDLTDPVQQACHGSALWTNLYRPGRSRIPLHLANVHALLDAGMMPTPDSDAPWSKQTLTQLADTGPWADPIRARIDAFHVQQSLQAVLPGATDTPRRKVL